MRIIPSVLYRFDNRLYFQMTGELSRVPLLLLLPTAPSRSRPPCSVPETPCLCSSLGWRSPPLSIGWRRQSSPTLITVLGSPGPSNVVRIEIAVLFSYVFIIIQDGTASPEGFPIVHFFLRSVIQFPQSILVPTSLRGQ